MRLGGANNMRPLSWGGGGGTNGKDPSGQNLWGLLWLAMNFELNNFIPFNPAINNQQVFINIWGGIY